MALIRCPECGKEISDKSESCIHCGYTNTANVKKEKYKKYILLLIVFLICMITLLTIRSSYNKNDNFGDSSEKIDLSIEATEAYLDEIYTEFLETQDTLVNAMLNYGDFETEHDIKEFELTWVLAVESFSKDIEILSKYNPASEYKEMWKNFDKYISNLIEFCKYFTDLDTNDDGVYTNEEGDALYNKYASKIKNNIVDFLEECKDYKIQKIIVSTPNPETTQEPETSKNQSYTQENKKSCVECGKSAYYTYTNPFSYKVENYCYTHYNEIISIMGEMEEDVGKGSYSKHTCEQCSREGTHTYYSFTGQTEYYCTQHYEELKSMLNSFGLN